MNKITLILCVLIYSTSFSQIKGTVTDRKGKPLSFVSIYLNKTVTGTTSNNNGEYVLDIIKKGNYTIVFQFLGYKTLNKKIVITKFPFVLDVVLDEEKVSLDEIMLSTKENPANIIIRKTIANKGKNTSKWANFTANFYSRGLFKVKDAPKKIFGLDVGDFGGGLDSTRSGVIYLSETMSKITYQKNPKLFKEKITASKVSGENNGISLNRAQDMNLDFYQNIVPFGNKLISPIADAAFSHYKYKLVGSFYEKNGKLINKIKLISKHKNDRVFGGFIYIVEDDWAIYGTDITVTGAQANIPVVDVLGLKQTYNYSTEIRAWVLISQTINFKVNIFGLKMNGQFSAAYSNYNFRPKYDDTTFTNEILSFSKNATKKDSVYWNKLRPVPLTKEEIKDYIVKDSIKTVRTSKKYLDSTDAKKNKFKMISPITGYTYRNSYKKWRVSYKSLLTKINFNPVQGWNTIAEINYFKRENEKGKYVKIGGTLSYGLSEKKVRPAVYFTKKWNNFSYPIFRASAGITTAQFNNNNPINNINNTIYSLFYKENYQKIYEKIFAKVSFSKEIKNGIRLTTSLEFANRKPLFNTTNYSFRNKNTLYSSNNPLDGTNYTAPFTQHKIFTANIGARFVFNQKYLMYPNSKYNITNNKYPTVFVNYRSTFGASNSQLNSNLFTARLRQFIDVGRFGSFKYTIKGGVFLQKKNIAFMDYTHFNGNQIYETVSTGYKNKFGLLDYYAFSTNDKFVEFHTEQDFEGFLLNKIPLIRLLNFHFVAGAKALLIGSRKPYTEYSLGLNNVGFGKWRLLRIDYVKSHYNGVSNHGVKFGINF